MPRMIDNVDQMYKEEDVHVLVVPNCGFEEYERDGKQYKDPLFMAVAVHEGSGLAASFHSADEDAAVRVAKSKLMEMWVQTFETRMSKKEVDIFHQFIKPLNFEEWVDMQHELQKTFDMDPDNYKGEELANYVRWNVLAAIDELMEFLTEWRWKPWDREDLRGKVDDRAAAKRELADVMHFIANLAIALNISGTELGDEYISKVAENRRRAAGSYDARTKLTAREKDRAAERAGVGG